MAVEKKKKELTYKGKPIYRKANRIYYGNLEDKYILILDVTETKKSSGINVATKVKIQLKENGENTEIGMGKTYRQTERDGLYGALDIGSWWLQDAIRRDSEAEE